MRTLPMAFCSRPQAAMTYPSFCDTHQTSSTFFALSCGSCSTYPGTCLAEQVGVYAPGNPKMTTRLPRVASATDTLAGETGQASPNSVDSDRVASGMRSPILIMGEKPPSGLLASASCAVRTASDRCAP